jgi:hypothetical protein
MVPNSFANIVAQKDQTYAAILIHPIDFAQRL